MTSSETNPQHTQTYLAIDLGGTKIAGGIVDASGQVLLRHTEPTRAKEGREQVLGQLAKVIDALVTQVPAGSISAVGVGSAGVIDPATGVVVNSTDAIKGWKGTQLGAFIAEHTGLPVSIENDVRVHALGESWLGAARDARDYLMVAVGTGIGTAVIIDGAIRSGAHRLAGHAFGIEEYGAGPSLERIYNENAVLNGTAGAMDLREIATRAAGGESLAISVITTGAELVGKYIASAMNLIDPDLVIINGGVSDIGELWEKPLRAAINTHAHPELRTVPIVRATLGSDAALIGAAALARNILAQ